jgi:hypothetical protein
MHSRIQFTMHNLDAVASMHVVDDAYMRVNSFYINTYTQAITRFNNSHIFLGFNEYSNHGGN